MLIDGIQLVEGSALTNATIAAGEQHPGDASPGELFFRSDLNKLHIFDGVQWADIGQAAEVTSVFGRTGDVVLTSEDVTDAISFIPQDVAEKDVANGYVGLGPTGKISTSVLPAITITDTSVVSSEEDMLALTAETGDVAVRSDISKSFILQGSDPSVLADWQELLAPSDAVQSVNGMSGVVTLTSTNIAEGTNLYYTDVRAAAAAPVQSVNGSSGAVVLTTANVAEDTNLYHTSARAAAAAPVQTVNGQAGSVVLTTTSITEGTNLYHTTSRAADAAPVQSVFGRTGAVVLTSADVTTALTFTPANKVGDTFTGNLGVQAVLEKFNPVAASPTSTQAIDVNTAAVWYFTVAQSANTTLNFRGNSGTTLNNTMAVGQTLTTVVLLTQGATAFYPTAYQIDGSVVTPKWAGTAPTSGNINSIDAYTLTIIKTAASTFTVLASRSKFA